MKLTAYKLLIFILFSLVFIHLNGCKKKPFTEVVEVEVESQGSFEFRDGITLVSDSTTVSKIRVHTNPENSKLYFSINGGEVKERKDYWIQVDSNIQYLDFYTSVNKSSTENYRLNINYGDNYLELLGMKVYPNPVSDSLHLEFDSHDRGEVRFTVMDVRGKLILTQLEFKSHDIFSSWLSLGYLDVGIYFLQVKYGDSVIVYRLAKN